jgi:FKBP-type peptidyl-prolyl cis-trans isomerase
VALAKIQQLRTELAQWQESISAAKDADDAPTAPVAVTGPPAESVPYSINTTFAPPKCPRKSVEGATMKVHYVGKLVATGKIFASSFHTGSQPFRFTLGSDEVLSAWNQGLDGMCEGERRRLMVPWHMAFGEKGTNGVPPFSDLQYDFELVELSVPKIPKAKGTKGEL